MFLLFIFPNGYQPFLFLLHSLHLPHLFTFFITPFFFFSLQKPPPLFSSHLLILLFSQSPSFSHFLSKLSPSFPMAAKAKKSSYIISFDVFYLTRWSGAMKLMGPLPLTYRPENHIPMAESINFQFFLIFKFLSNLLF